MNKQERIIAFLLGLVLVGWLVYTQRQAAKQLQTAAQAPTASVPAATLPAATNQPAATLSAPGSISTVPLAEVPLASPTEPEHVVTLTGNEMSLNLSSYGAVLKQVTLSDFATLPGKQSAENPPVSMDFAEAPALALSGLPNLAPNAAYTLQADDSKRLVTCTTVTEQGLHITRRIELLTNYQIRVTDTLRNTGTQPLTLGTNAVQVGVMHKGASKNELLSIDSLPIAAKKATHWGSEKITKPFLVAGGAGGCSRAPSAVGMADQVTVPILNPQAWVALKSRFFVTLFSSPTPNNGFIASMVRDPATATYSLSHLSARVLFPGQVLSQGETLTRNYLLYVGPKKLSLLQDMGNKMEALMEFGTFTWFCKLLVPTLNFFHRIVPDYGIAIILLTFLVRIIFWPLTHKSTQSMKKMQDIQPKLKEIQAKFKDNPKKLQQETWAIYRENKVNPLSSCLPMLIQIPVFIALFTVLRSAVELRYAPFLWIVDLSEPENLFAGILPIPLNILPILMSGTMALQSYLTPSMGDPQQQKMMMIMMPIMMLYMFYSFPAALSLYWTVSQALSIIQMLMLRKRNAPPTNTDSTNSESLTRQQRRQVARG